MTLRTLQHDDVGHAFITMLNGPQHRVATSCGHCKAKAIRQCDWKLRDGVTCGMPLCEEHCHAPTLERDLCPGHARRWAAEPQQIGLI